MQNLIIKSKTDKKTPNKKIKTFKIFGVNYNLMHKKNNKNLIEINGNNAILGLKENITEKQKDKFIKEWYRNLLKDEIDILLPMIENETKLHCSTYGTKDMTTRWGSCSIKSKKIWLNVKLAKRPKECLKYVILHELLHTKFPKHTKEFQAELEKFMPNWKEYHLLLEK